MVVLWNKYFGFENCQIYGIDIDPSCTQHEHNNIKIIIGDQGDKNFLESIMKSIPSPDILIDDGGHTMMQQINTFEVLYDHVKRGGIYLCEDTHTSYWQQYGGGLNNPDSFIEHTKKLIDKMNAYHHKSGIDSFTRSCLGIYYYDSMVFFEKAELPINEP